LLGTLNKTRREHSGSRVRPASEVNPIEAHKAEEGTGPVRVWSNPDF